MPVFGLASDENLSASSTTTLSLGPLSPPSAEQQHQRPLTSNPLKYGLPELETLYLKKSECSLSPLPGHPQAPCFYSPGRAISPFPPPSLPIKSASFTHLISQEMSNPLDMPQGNSGCSPENTPPGTRPMNFRPVAPISTSSARLETLASLLRLDPALPSNYGKSPTDPAISNNKGSLFGVLERDPKDPCGNSSSQIYAPAPAAHKVHIHATASPTFDVFGEAPYQPDVVSGVTEDILAMDMYLHEKEELIHKDNRWWNSHPLHDTCPVLQCPHHTAFSSPPTTPFTNLQSGSRLRFPPPSAYPSYSYAGSSSLSPSTAGAIFVTPSGDLSFSPKRDEDGKRLVNQCALDEFKQKSMEEHRWDTYDANFPPLSLSPPASTLLGFEARHTQASGSPTVVPDGMPLPVPPAIWDTTSYKVHVVPSVADPPERDSLPASSADRSHYSLSGHPLNPHYWKKITYPDPGPVLSVRTEDSKRGAAAEPAGAGDKQTGSVGSSLDNATCIPSILNMPRIFVAPNLLYQPQLFSQGPADTNSTRIHQQHPANNALVEVVAPEVLLSPRSFEPLKVIGPETGVNFNVTTQELKGIHPMIASLGYLSHVLQTFQSSPSHNSELEANCKVLETTIGNVAKCLCAQQDKVLQTLLKADITPPRKADGITSVKIVDQRSELNQSGGKTTQAAGGKFTAEGSTSGGAPEVQLDGRKNLHELSAKCLGTECGARESQLVSKMLQPELENKDTKLRNVRHKAHKMKAQVADLQSWEEQLRATTEELTEALQLNRVENKGRICPITNQGGGGEFGANAGSSLHGSSPEMLDCSSKMAQFNIHSALVEQTVEPNQETIDAQDKPARSKMWSDFATDGNMKHPQVGDISPSCGEEGDTETTEAYLLAKVQIHSALIQSRAICTDDAGKCETPDEEGWDSSAQFDGVSASLEKSSPGSSSSLTVEAANEVAVAECASDLANGNRQQSICLRNSEVNDVEGLLLFSESKASAANICKSSVVTQDPTPADEGAAVSGSDTAGAKGHSKKDHGKPGILLRDMAEALGWEHVKAEV